MALRGGPAQRLEAHPTTSRTLSATAPQFFGGVADWWDGAIGVSTVFAAGDLMARAGVSYAVGREPVSRYREPLNGICAQTPFHQFEVPVDPYVHPGDPSSGLLPLIKAQLYRLLLEKFPAQSIDLVFATKLGTLRNHAT